MKKIITLSIFCLFAKSIMIENNQVIEEIVSNHEIQEKNFFIDTKELPKNIKNKYHQQQKQCRSLSETRTNLYKELGINQPKFPTKKINVAVIDTGLDFSIPAFRNKIYKPIHLNIDLPHNFYGFNVTGNNLKEAYEPKDEYGHGTHVAGIIIAMFPNANILPIKIMSDKKSGSYYLAKAIKIAIMAEVDIINISNGGPHPSDDELEAIKEAEEHGILVVSAAGNENKNLKDSTSKFYPASYELKNMISVMSHDNKGEKLKSSNYGKDNTDIMALGQINSYTSYSIKGCQETYHGTSQATPVVTATLAMIMSQNPDWDYMQVKNALLNSVDKDEKYATLNKTSGKLNILRSLSDENSGRQLASLK